jgi:Xaa-Pro dipeptidase
MAGNIVTGEVERNLRDAQAKAAALFAEVAGSGMIRPGILESELSAAIDALARERYGLRRHWHRRVVRTGRNTVLTYYDDAEDLRIGDDDLVVVDLGPVFGEWEADFGRSYVLGADPRKRQVVGDIAAAFALGRELYQALPNLTAGALYDYMHALAADFGWEFGAPTAGHLVGHFPHEQPRDGSRRFSIRSGNDTPLREPDDAGHPRHWILEVHFVDRERGFGAFCEELLTI